jgi:hypothetical protein
MSKRNNNNDPIEKKVLSYFKSLKSEDITKIKDLANKVKDILNQIDEEKEQILNEARESGEEIKKAAKENAHKSENNIIENAKKKANKIIEDADIEKNQLLNVFQEELKNKIAIKENEWKEKDELIKETQHKLKLKIDEKEKELYEIKSMKFDEYEKDLNHRFNSLSKELEKKASELKTKYTNFTDSTKKDISEKNDMANELEEIKIDNEKLNSKLTFYKKYIETHPSRLFTELENENKLLKEQVEQLEEMLRKNNDQIISYKKKVAELLSDPNLEQEIEILKAENEDLKDFKNNSFSQESVLEWKTKAEAYDQIVVENLDLTEENTKLLTIIDQEKVDKVRLSRLNTAHQILSNELEQARYDLEMRRDEYRNIENRFVALNDIDLKYQNYTKEDTNQNISLKNFVDRFRAYMASGWYHEKLYFDLTTLRAFIAGMASSNLIILEGLSGTGKSSLPQAFGAFVSTEKSNTNLISVQQSWRDRNELLGYFNEFTKTYKETEFLKVLYEAVSDHNNIHIIVLDEMNIARVEYYFADFLSAMQMQDSKRYINLTSNHSIKDPNRLEKGSLLVNNNVWFVGTANDDDSTFMISDKVYDRAISIYFDKKGEEESIRKDEKYASIQVGSNELHDMFEKAITSNKLSDNFLKKIFELDDFIKEKFGITFGNRIEKQIKKFIPVFVEAGGSQEEAFDLIFERKVLRKFESRLNANMKNGLDDLELFMDETFGESELNSSKKMIKNLKEKY